MSSIIVSALAIVGAIVLAQILYNYFQSRKVQQQSAPSTALAQWYPTQEAEAEARAVNRKLPVVSPADLNTFRTSYVRWATSDCGGGPVE